MTLHDDALLIARRAIDAAMPDAAVRRAWRRIAIFWMRADG